MNIFFYVSWKIEIHNVTDIGHIYSPIIERESKSFSPPALRNIAAYSLTY